MFAGSRLLLPVSINFVTLVPKPGRKEGHAAEGDRGAEEIGQQEVAETASGCPKRWCWSKEEQVGRKTRCRAPGSRRGGCRPRGSGGVGPVRLKAEACCHPPCLGRSREWGTRCRLPSTGGAIAVRQEAEEHRAIHQRCPVPSHGTASEPLSWLRTERQCVREPDRDYFFFLSPLSLLCHSSSFRLLFSRLVCPYPQVRRGRPDGLPPGEGGGGE